MDARQDAYPDIGPIMRWKRAGNDRPRWEDISPESREAKVLWRQWERLYLVSRVLHRRFHELEGQGWQPQLVVPADRRGIVLQRFHGGAIGAHLGTARTLALAEQGFYWPGKRADVSRICTECDCAMLKKRRGLREPLHQYIVGVLIEGLAMDVAGPYPVTSTGKQYCLMVPCLKCGNRVQRQYMRKHDRNMHQGARRRKHTCLYCSVDKAKTYSTFLDWKKPMSTAWRAMIHSGGRNTLRGSNWTNGDGSTSWKGARQTGLTSVSGLCGSIMAGTKARERDSHRDRRPP